MGEHVYFATVAKGLEEVLAAELRGLGIEPERVDSGGVLFRGDLATCYRANLCLRTANRVLVRLTEFPCTSPEELYAGVRQAGWSQLLTPEMTIAVDATVRDSALTHSHFVALKTKDAIVDTIRDQTGRRPSVDARAPSVRVNVHLARNICTLSLDSSGDPLDRRGYRLDRTSAPLRETLAAGLVLLTGWDGSTPLVDPMCGSGTILVEGAMVAARMAPGLLRERFGFMGWREFDQPLWNRLKDEARQSVRSLEAPLVFGSDLSWDALRTSEKNLARSGVAALVQVRRAEIGEVEPPAGSGTILVNPPYGERLGQREDLGALYKRLGDIFKQRWKGYTAFLFTADRELAKRVGLKASKRIVLWNGPLECRLYRYDLY